MGQLMNWVRTIGLFLIFITLFYQILPGGQYQRYIRLYAGLVLLLLVTKPLFSLFHLEESFQWNQDLFSWSQEAEDFRLKAEAAEEEQYGDILEACENAVVENVGLLAQAQGLYLVSCQVKLSQETEKFGQIESLDLTVSRRKPRETEGQEGKEGEGTVNIEPVEIVVGEGDGTAPSPENSPDISAASGEESGGDTGTASPGQEVRELRAQLALMYEIDVGQINIVLEM